MSLKGRYHNVLYTDLLLQELKNGAVPNLDELEQQVLALEAANPLLGERPLVSLEAFDIDFYENASASKWNSTLTSQKRDITAMYDTIKDLSDLTLKQGRRWSAYYESVRRSLLKLENRIENLLLLKRDTLGYFAFVADGFDTMEFVDQANTSARIDTNAGVVTMKQESVPGEVARLIPTSSWSATKQILNVVNLVVEETPAGTGASNALTDEYTQWLSTVRTETAQVVTHSLQINLDQVRGVSKVVFTPFGSTGTSAFAVSLLYSQNGVDFILVPGQASQSLVGTPGVWVFPEIQAKHFRFVITKSGYDDIDLNNYFVYEFGCKNVSLYNPTFSLETGSVLQSVQLSVLNEDLEKKVFSKVALSTCDFKPDGTDIYYYVSVDNGVSFIPISPIEDTSPSHPQIVDFTDSVPVNNISSLNLFDSTKTATQIDSDENHGITLDGPTDVVVNSYVPQADVSDVIESSYVVYRNLGEQGELVRGTSSGWVYDADNNTYTTIVRVDDPNGYEIDLGSSFAIIDDVSRTGSFVLSKGDHVFKTDAENWDNVDVSSPASDEVSLQSVDSLYPYNHKLIVEGYPYPSSFTGDKIYFGGSFWAGSMAGYISQHEFKTLSDTSELSVYTRRVDSNGNLAFVFKTQQGFGDHLNERFRFEYKLPTRTFTDITLKAVLSTFDASVSPLIDSYTIKLG